MMKWGDVKIADSIQVSQEGHPLERKKWDSPKKSLGLEVQSQEMVKLGSQDTPKFVLNTIPEERFGKLQNNELEEDIEEDLVEEHTDPEQESEEGSENAGDESNKEIHLSQPRFEETGNLLVAPDSLRGSEEENYFQSTSLASSIHKEPKQASKVESRFIFQSKIENATEDKLTSELANPKHQDIETSTDIINSFLQCQDKSKGKTRQLIGKSQIDNKGLMISRLNEARMYAKQHKVKDIFDELDTKLMDELSKPRLTPRPVEESQDKPNSQAGFTGKFTKVALNELRKQKYQNSTDNILQDSRPNSKNSQRQVVDDFINQFDKEETIYKNSTGSRQSRRYENQDANI